jgi:DNA-binding MurR/RpiR family transcriptional regulator
MSCKTYQTIKTNISKKNIKAVMATGKAVSEENLQKIMSLHSKIKLIRYHNVIPSTLLKWFTMKRFELVSKDVYCITQVSVKMY